MALTLLSRVIDVNVFVIFNDLIYGDLYGGHQLAVALDTHCLVAFESSRIARFITIVKNKW